MTPKWVERQVDEALLLIATQAAFLYAHRRARRLLPKVVVGTVVMTGVGAAAATAAAGIGAVGLVGGAVAWYRHRSQSTTTVAPGLGGDWRPAGAGVPPAAVAGSNSGESPVQDTQSELSPNE